MPIVTSYRPRGVLWDPTWETSRFMVGSSSEIRLYEWTQDDEDDKEDDNETRVKTVTVLSELGQIRTFDWGPRTAQGELVSIGLANGRALLLQVQASWRRNVRKGNGNGIRGGSNAGTGTPVTAVNLSSRQSRAVNEVVFNSTSSADLLAVGLEKVRTESVLVYDVHATDKLFQPNAPDPAPVLSLVSGESVNALSFMKGHGTSGRLLASALGNKWLRLYDLRGKEDAGISWHARNVAEIVPSERNENWFLTHSSEPDGIVKLWDIRWPQDPMLAFSSADTGSRGSTSHESGAGAASRGINQVLWSRERSDIVTTLHRDQRTIREWSVVEGPKGRVPNAPPDVRTPYVLDDRELVTLEDPAISIACAKPPFESPNASHIVAISSSNRQGLEFVESTCPAQARFSYGALAYALGGEEPQVAITRQLMGHAQSLGPSAANSRTSTVSEDTSEASDSETSSTSTSDEPLSSQETLHSETKPFYGIDLRSDPWHVMQQRLREEQQSGQTLYARRPFGLSDLGSSDPHASNFLTDWIVAADRLIPHIFAGRFDFRFRGVMDILQGFEPTFVGILDGNKTVPPMSPAEVVEWQNMSYAAAVRFLVRRLQLDETLVRVPQSGILNERLLALHTCRSASMLQADPGPDDEKMSRGDHHAAIARNAFFRGDFHIAVKHLRKVKHPSMRLLAPILAAFLAESSDASSESPVARGRHRAPSQTKASASWHVYNEVCQNLSVEIEEPWIRAMFTFLSSGGEWRELLDESGLELADRVTIALRFLHDHELMSFLKDLASQVVSKGHLEGVVLFGLNSTSSLALLKSFANRTGDFQTLAHIGNVSRPSASTPIGIYFAYWRDIYRSALNRLQNFSTRALFDMMYYDRHRRSHARLAARGYLEDARAVEAELTFQPQLSLVCQFCNEVISVPDGAQGVKSNVCLKCGKGLNVCSICLSRPLLSDEHDEENVSSAFARCEQCQHGGHVAHLLEWFQSEALCPVIGCDCRCMSVME